MNRERAEREYELFRFWLDLRNQISELERKMDEERRR